MQAASTSSHSHLPMTRQLSTTSQSSFTSQNISIIHSALQGCIICITGMSSDRDKYLQIAVQLNAKVTRNLTGEVTHLIAQTIESEKYKMASRRADMIPVRPQWLQVCWERALKEPAFRGIDIVHEYRIPCLSACTISITGFEPPERTSIQEQCQALGATFQAVMPRSATHLLVAEGVMDNQSSKIRYAVAWGIQLVRMGWLLACAKQQYHVDEKAFLYEPPASLLSAASSLSGPQPITVSSTFIESTTNTVDADTTKPYLEGCHIYLAQHVPYQDKYRRIIIAAGGMRYTSLNQSNITHVIASGALNEKEKHLLLQLACPPLIVTPDWLIACHQSQSKQSATLFLSTAAHFEQLSARQDETVTLHEDSDVVLVPKRRKAPSSTDEKPPKVPEGLQNLVLRPLKEWERKMSSPPASGPFSGFVFCTESLSVSQSLFVKQHVSELGGKYYAALEEVVSIHKKGFLIVPIEFKKTIPTRLSIATIFWFEQCVHQKQLLPLVQKPLFQPIRYILPLPCFSPIHICPTGYQGIERDHIKLACQLLGAVYEENFTKRTGYLLCKEAQGMKYERAMKRGIPCVSAEWLDEAFRVKAIPLVKGFLVTEQTLKQDENQVQNRHEPAQDISSAVQQKPDPLTAAVDALVSSHCPVKKLTRPLSRLSTSPMESSLVTATSVITTISTTTNTATAGIEEDAIQISYGYEKKRRLLPEKEESKKDFNENSNSLMIVEENDSFEPASHVSSFQSTLMLPSNSQVPCFILSSLEAAVRVKLIAAIKELGGTVLDKIVDWHPRCTHLVTGTVSRSGKFMSACASGAWIVKPCYIEHCIAAKRFLDPLPYEWTSQEGCVEKEAFLLPLPRAWRCHLQEKKKTMGGAFCAWRVLLWMTESRVPSFRSMIESTGGRVDVTQEPLTLSVVQKYTHIIVEKNVPLQFQPSDHQVIHAHHQTYFTFVLSDYLIHYLIKGASQWPLSAETEHQLRQMHQAKLP